MTTQIIAGESIEARLNFYNAKTAQKIVNDQLQASVELYNDTGKLDMPYSVGAYNVDDGFFLKIPTTSTENLSGAYKLLFTVSDGVNAGKKIVDLFVQTIL
tara:strand:+ start:9560 stop:9862 length:303 start_codon:yes stop_codon:yes gene_type:complete